MPTYQYKCEECNHRFKVLQFAGDEDLKPAICPKCKAETTHILSHANKRMLQKARFAPKISADYN